jgi:hypothetical protein
VDLGLDFESWVTANFHESAKQRGLERGIFEWVYRRCSRSVEELGWSLDCHRVNRAWDNE